MVVTKSNVMYECQAFYIGSGRPDAGKKGVESVQGPLRDRYRSDVSEMVGNDVTISVTPDFINIEYTDNITPEFSLPISTLNMCAAVRCVESAGDKMNMKFIPVHSVVSANEPDSKHPAIFTTVMRRSVNQGDKYLCHMFVCESARDGLHLVNATQTAHTALRRGYSASGTLKFFNEQSSEFDRTIQFSGSSSGRRASASSTGGEVFVRDSSSGRIASASSAGGEVFVRESITRRSTSSPQLTRSQTKTIHLSNDVVDSRNDIVVTNMDNSTTYVRTTADDSSIRRAASVSRSYNDTNYVTNGTDATTYYVKTSDIRMPVTPTTSRSGTIVVKSNHEYIKAQTPMPQQTIIVDKPILRPAAPVEIPPPKIIERPVYIEPPPAPKLKPQVIYVDKPVFKDMKWPVPPRPSVIERPVYIEPPPPPRQEPQRIIIDKPVIKDWPKPAAPPPPIIEENPVYIDPPQWPVQAPQRIIVDKPIVREPGPAPPPPAPIIEERPVYIDPPPYPEQQPQRIVVEKPVFNPPKPAPPPPAPIIEEKPVYIDPPAYPRQEPMRIIVEKPIIQDPGPPPPPPPPIIIEKPVHIEAPKYQPQEPQRIIVEKPIMRDPGPPPPPPKPIIIEKIVYIDPPPWPVQEPQRIIVEKPVFRPRPPPTIPKPIIIEKPVYIDAPPPPLIEPQRIVVEKPILRPVNTVYAQTEIRRVPSASSYTYLYQHKPANARSSYVMHSAEPRLVQGQGLRRYTWSEAGDARVQQSRVDYNSDTGGGYRVYGQPRDFRERQFINEKRFGERVSNDFRQQGVRRIEVDRSSVSS